MAPLTTERRLDALADYLKIPDIARRLDVSEPTARRMVKGGKLPSVFIGGAYRVNEEDLETYIENARVLHRPKAEALPELEAGERREPKVVTGSAVFEGTGELKATGRIRKILEELAAGDISVEEAEERVLELVAA